MQTHTSQPQTKPTQPLTQQPPPTTGRAPTAHRPSSPRPRSSAPRRWKRHSRPQGQRAKRVSGLINAPGMIRSNGVAGSVVGH